MTLAAGTELLDDPSADPVAVRRSLTNIARSNRLFGGTAAVLWGLEQVLGTHEARATTPEPLVLLDIGTGAGDIPAAARRWGRRRGLAIRTLGLERLRPAARLARSVDLPVTLGCLTALPLRDRSVDLVVVSQVLHHLDAETATRLLGDAGRLARRGVVIADLLRSRTAAALFGVAARALGFDRHTRADGVTSVARGYRVDELAALAAAAGVPASVTGRLGWRVVAWWRTPGHT
ncbi:MAG: methyltransferase domain-containing protein [Gemmatimonadetes bacterium]|nr:methyltransferase domain-containing protein [Gemmatimonadota bacterium]